MAKIGVDGMVRGRIRQFCSKIVIVDESFSLPIGVSTTILARGGEYVKISQRGDSCLSCMTMLARSDVW